MKQKGGKKANPVKKGATKPKTSLSQKEPLSGIEPEIPSVLNEELEELLKKNTKRFFGGCGG